MNTDVIIVGGGVSGLVLSVLLKEQNIDHIVLKRVEKQKTLELPETLPPSTMVLLESLNLLELFSKSSSKTFGYHSLWYSDTLTTDNFFYHNPYKYGLKLHKKQLLQDLEALVSHHVLPFNNLLKLHQTNDKVSLTIESDNTAQTIKGKIVVDATGRKKAILKQLGIHSESFDDQVALSCHLPYIKHPKLIYPVFVESFEYGWGIVTSLNEQLNSITLYTKKGSPILPQLKEYQNWKNVLSNTKILKDFLTDYPNCKIAGGIANTSKSSQIAGSNWLAIGDAAIAFDPLSSHGISNAIYCAKLASSAIRSYMTNDTISSFENYENIVFQIFNEYLKQKIELYDREVL